jgi:hypothetical protein
MAQESKKSEQPLEEQPSPPEWVILAQAHFAATGAYRSSDVQRLLGDQKQSVDVSPKSDATVSADL